MKNVLIIISLLTFLSCKKDEKPKKSNLKEKNEIIINKDSIVEGYYLFKDNLYQEVNNKENIIPKMNFCDCEKLNFSTKLYKKTILSTKDNYIEVSVLNAYFKNDLETHSIDFINKFDSYDDVLGFERTFFSELQCEKSSLILKLNQQSIDDFYVKFSFKKNEIQLNKVYIKTHYQNYIEYIREIDTCISYMNKSKIMIDEFYKLTEKKPRKAIIVDSTTYEESLPQ